MDPTALDTDQQPDVREEIRLAVVLNGGVSLAVWMGGVTLEIDRLTRREGPYDYLLRLVASSARADVITGTSAGGINGAALALAQLNSAADLRSLRGLWAEHGRMEALLRTPFSGSPASLLQGDEYFLPTLERALGGLATDYAAVPADERPVHLGITTTLLRGGRKVVSDSLGQALPQAVHAGLLTFRHLPTIGAAADPGNVDDFAGTEIATTVRRLALAARSSASFPVAFEPSFLPVVAVGPVSPGTPVDDRPDMRRPGNWFDSRDGTDQSRYAVDGGVLVNTPTVQAVEAIEELPAQNMVRRMMLLVFPHAPLDATIPAQRKDEPPTVVQALGQMFGAMRNEAGRTHIESVLEHNHRAANKRGGRIDVLVSVWRDTVIQQTSTSQLVEQLNATLFSHYRDLRIRRAARDLSDRVPAVAGWPYDRVLRAAEQAQCDEDQQPEGPVPRIPYVWDDALWEESMTAGVSWPWGLTTAQHVVDDVLDLVKRLSWVADAGEHAALAAAYQQLSKDKAVLHHTRATLDALWNHPALVSVAPSVAYWRLRLGSFRAFYLAESGPGVETLLPLVQQDRDSRSDPEHTIRLNDFTREYARARQLPPRETGGPARSPGQVADDTVRAAAAQVLALSGVLRAAADVRRAQGDADHARPSLCGNDQDALVAWDDLVADIVDDYSGVAPEVPAPADAIDRVVTRLVRLDVVTSCLTTSPDEGSEQIIELTQISLQTDSAFQRFTLSGSEKLGGNRLGRFAGFLKESWRVNDWTWGRLDAATMLCRIVLDPQRVRRTLLDGPHGHLPPADAAAATVDDLVLALYPAGLPDLLAGRLAIAEQELVDHVFGTASDDPPATLEGLADLIAYAVQADVAAEELPVLAGAIEADQRDGAPSNSAGARLVADNTQLLADLRSLPVVPRGPVPGHGPVPPAPTAAVRHRRAELGQTALAVFDRAGVGREALSQEAASDLMIRTAASAMAVGVTVVDSPQFGIKAIKPFTRVVRGVALAPYWLARGLAGSGRIGQALALAGLAFGGAMLGLSLLTSTPTWLTLIGVGTLLGGLAYSALRTGSLVHGLVLGLPAVPLSAFAVARKLADDADAAPAADSIPAIVLLALLVLGLYVMGSVPGLVRSPRALVADLWRAALAKQATWSPPVRALTWSALIAGLVALVVAGWRADLAQYLTRDRVLVGLVVLVWLVFTAWAADRGSRQFRVWYWGRGSDADPTRTRLRSRRVAIPGAIAAAWSCVYAWLATAAVVTLLALADARHLDLTPGKGSAPGEWAFASSVVTLAVAAVLLFAAVFILPIRVKVRFRRRLLREARSGAFRLVPTGPQHAQESAVQAALRERLVGGGNAFRYLLRASGDGQTLRLSPRGEALAGRLAESVA